MASGDQMKKLVGMMLAAIMLVAAAVAKPEQEAGACIGNTSDVPGAANPCICSKNCACAGKCILNAVDGDDLKTCFVECVLKIDCVRCPGPLPASLDKTLRLSVTRLKVPRDSKDPAEELFIGVVVQPRGTGTVRFDVYVNLPEGGKVGNDSPHYVWTFEATPDKIANMVVRRPEISSALKRIGADGDKTIVVSLVPRDWGDRVTIVSVKIV